MTDDINQAENISSALPSPFPSEDAKKLLLSTLAIHRVARVVVEFSGSGDSGSIQYISLEGGEDSTLNAVKIPWSRKSSQFVDGKWQHQTTESPMSLRNVLESVTYEALESSNLDWYNNDGGQGEFVIDLDGPDGVNISLEMGINYTRTDDYSFHFSGTPAKDE